MHVCEQLALPFTPSPRAAVRRPRIWVLAGNGLAVPTARRTFFVDPNTGIESIAADDLVLLRRGAGEYFLYLDPRSGRQSKLIVDALDSALLSPSTTPLTRVGPIQDFLSVGFTGGRAGDPVVRSGAGQIVARTHFEQLLFTVARRRTYSAIACVQAARTLDKRAAGRLHEGIAAIVERERADALNENSWAPDIVAGSLQLYRSSWARFAGLGLAHQMRAARRAETSASSTAEQPYLPGFEDSTSTPIRDAALGYAIRRACGFPLELCGMEASELASHPARTGFFQLADHLRLPDRHVVAVLSGASSPYRKVVVQVTPEWDGFALEVGAQDEMNHLLGRPLSCELQSDVRVISVACDTLHFREEPVAIEPGRAASFACRPSQPGRHDVRAAVLLKSGAQMSLRFELANRPNRTLMIA